MKPLTLAALTLLGFALGYFLVILLPAIFVTWLESYVVETHDHVDETSIESEPAGWMYKMDDGTWVWAWYPRNSPT